MGWNRIHLFCGRVMFIVLSCIKMWITEARKFEHISYRELEGLVHEKARELQIIVLWHVKRKNKIFCCKVLGFEHGVLRYGKKIRYRQVNNLREWILHSDIVEFKVLRLCHRYELQIRNPGSIKWLVQVSKVYRNNKSSMGCWYKFKDSCGFQYLSSEMIIEVETVIR